VIAEGLSAYLAKYPHGCTEQIVSQVFPLVGLSNLAKYAPENETVALQFAQAISKLRQRQSYVSGLGYLDDTAANFVRSSTNNSSASLSLLTLRKHAQGIYLLTHSGVVTSNLLIDLAFRFNVFFVICLALFTGALMYLLLPKPNLVNYPSYSVAIFDRND
jgi:hypothetical protein